MKKTLKHFLTESQKLPHWPKTKEDLKFVYNKCSVDADTGEVYLPLFEEGVVEINDDLTISLALSFTNSSAIINRNMLVDGKLPFPFKEINCELIIDKHCDLDSLLGLPKKVKMITFEARSLSSSITNFVGGPEEASSFTVTGCDGITSIQGLPKVDENGNIWLECKNIKDFSELPRKLETLSIAYSIHFSNDDLKYLPSEAKAINFHGLPKLTSFHNIHKFIKRVNRIELFDVKIFYSVLGLALINGLTEIDDCFYDNFNPNDSDISFNACGIVQQFIGSHDIFEFQEKLEEAGFKELAQL